jgi:hypothetical protein
VCRDARANAIANSRHIPRGTRENFSKGNVFVVTRSGRVPPFKKEAFRLPEFPNNRQKIGWTKVLRFDKMDIEQMFGLLPSGTLADH